MGNVKTANLGVTDQCKVVMGTIITLPMQTGYIQIRYQIVSLAPMAVTKVARPR